MFLSQIDNDFTVLSLIMSSAANIACVSVAYPSVGLSMNTVGLLDQPYAIVEPNP